MNFHSNNCTKTDITIKKLKRLMTSFKMQSIFMIRNQKRYRNNAMRAKKDVYEKFTQQVQYVHGGQIFRHQLYEKLYEHYIRGIHLFNGFSATYWID